jgi:hypothetical protein
MVAELINRLVDLCRAVRPYWPRVYLDYRRLTKTQSFRCIRETFDDLSAADTARAMNQHRFLGLQSIRQAGSSADVGFLIRRVENQTPAPKPTKD